MLNAQQLHGVYVPIVTPFKEDGELDSESFRRYLAQLMQHNIAGIVVNGTTGESPTVTWPEVHRLMEDALELNRAADTEKPIILGTGTYDTATTVTRTEQAAAMGADAALVVVPYYSRPSQRGIIEHYKAAAQTGVPIIAYDIPTRTGIQLELDTIRAILEVDGVIGMKDSSGDLGRLAALTSAGTKPILCGVDELWVQSLAIGAAGGMLASASIRTEAFAEIMRCWEAGHLEEAEAIFDELLPMITLLFAESNPSPIKWVLAQQNRIASDAVRLPMTTITETLRVRLGEVLA